MTSQQEPKDDSSGTVPAEMPRLVLKPALPQQGPVDGRWRPCSADLAAALPDLLAELSARLGRIDRVLYNLKEWPDTPRRIVTGGNVVRLDGYSRQPVGTIEILGLNRERFILQVTSPGDQSGSAQSNLMAAAQHLDAVAQLAEFDTADRSLSSTVAGS